MFLSGGFFRGALRQPYFLRGCPEIPALQSSEGGEVGDGTKARVGRAESVENLEGGRHFILPDQGQGLIDRLFLRLARRDEGFG